MGLCLSLVDMLVGLLVSLFVGIGCCVACWLLALYVVILFRADAHFLRFLGEVLSVFLFSGSLLA